MRTFILFFTMTVMTTPAWAMPCRDQVEAMVGSARWYLDGVYDIEFLNIEVDAEDLCEQMTLNSLSGFNVAFERALDRIFYDDRDPFSPLAVFVQDLRRGWQDGGGDQPFDDLEDMARESLFDYLNRPTTVLKLMRLGEVAAAGESVRYNWIFRLNIPEYSRHTYWIVQDRTEEEFPYIYGIP